MAEGGNLRSFERSAESLMEIFTENIDYDYDDNEFIEALADFLIDKQEKVDVPHIHTYSSR